MTAYQPTSFGSDTKPFISGELTALSAVEDFAYDFIGSLTSHIDDLLDEASMALRNEASADSQWSTYANSLEVTMENGVISYTNNAGPQRDYEMSMLEFGGPENGPNPLLRSFAREYTQHISAELDKRLRRESPVG